LTGAGGQPDGLPVFGWESAHRGDGGRRLRKVIQCAVDLLAFCVVPMAGLVIFWVSGQGSGLLVALSVVEALMVGGLGWQVVSYARPFTPAAA
jgi:hypothetical protein